MEYVSAPIRDVRKEEGATGLISAAEGRHGSDQCSFTANRFVIHLTSLVAESGYHLTYQSLTQLYGSHQIIKELLASRRSPKPLGRCVLQPRRPVFAGGFIRQ